MCQECNKSFSGPIGKIVFVLSRSEKAHGEQLQFLLYIIRKHLGLSKDQYGIVTVQDVHTACYKNGLANKIKDADVVISLGVTAFKLLGGQGNITQQRGKAFKLGEKWIFPTVAPSYVLRSPNEGNRFKQELKQAVNLDFSHEPCPPVTPVVLGGSGIKPLFDQLVAAKYPIAVDIETGGGEGKNAYNGGYILAFGFTHNPYKGYVIPKEMLEDEEVKQAIRDFLTSDLNFVYQNGTFDVQYLREYLGTNDIHVTNDTMLMHYALDEEKGTHGLKDLARNFLGADDYESGLAKYIRAPKAEYDEWGDENDQVEYGEHDYARIPSEVLYRYLAHDVAYTLRLYKLFDPLLDRENKRGLYNTILMPIQDVLMDVEQYGIQIDSEYAARKVEEYKARSIDLNLRLQRIAGSELGWNRPIELGKKGQPLKRKPGYYEFNANSPKQVQDILYDRLKLKSNNPRKPRGTDRKILEYLAIQSNHPFVQDLLEYRVVSKILGTYLEGVPKGKDQNNRVHGRYNVHGTTTGRLSASNPNFQNIPRSSRVEGKDVKRMFVPAEGMTFIQGDFSQGEYRVAGILSGDSFLWNTYLEGGDLHSSMATALYTEAYTKEQRTKSKICNFLAMYGGGPQVLSDTLGISKSEASDILQNYWAKMPTLQQTISDWRAEAKKTGRLSTPLGRTRSWNFTDYENQHSFEKEAGNFPIQSVMSDMMLLSLIEIHGILKTEGWGRIVATVHDSLLIEAYPDKVKEVVELCTRVIEACPKKYLDSDFPFKCSFEIGRNWGDLDDYELPGDTQSN